MQNKCPECGSQELYAHGNVSLRGGQGPNLLPELGSFLFGPSATVVLCRDCGLVRIYADEKERKKLLGGNMWRKLK